MLSTDSPLTERMTLFWHNHFTSSLHKVRWPQLMYRQNVLLRRHALGNFADLLRDVAHDPAMLLYLDGISNRKGQPNENFARELLELFTLGEGHYTEEDVRAAARAFTGWSLDRSSGAFRFRRGQHDFGDKRFLGRSGTFDGDDIIDLLLAHPRTAAHITERLWREFISDRPDPAEVERLAAGFRGSGYELGPLLVELLGTPAFRDPANHGICIKSPVELVVGLARTFDIERRDLARILARIGRQLGQDILDPPDVSGWPGAESWITTSSLKRRQQLLQRLLEAAPDDSMMSDDEPAGDSYLRTWLASLGPRFTTADGLKKLLLPVAPAYPSTGRPGLEAELTHLLLDPAFQLK